MLSSATGARGFIGRYIHGPVMRGEQRLLDFARPDNIILTNIDIDEEALAGCSDALRKEITTTKSVIGSHHQRGADELPHRRIKDFGFEELPFKRFTANSAAYYLMVLVFFFFGTFKEDVLEDVPPIGSYATTQGGRPWTVRRRL